MKQAKYKEDHLVRFAWFVHPSGYRWDNGELMPINPGEKKQWYEPPETLFGEMADAIITPDKNEFANEYGPLVNTFDAQLIRASKKDVTFQWVEETFDHWTIELQLLREAVYLWDLLRTNNIPRLRETFTWRAGNLIAKGMYHAESKTSRDFVIPSSRDDFGLALKALIDGKSAEIPFSFTVPIASGDVKRAAQVVLTQRVGEKVHKHVSVEFNYLHGSPHLYFRPLSLLGMAWYQLAQAIVGEKHYIRCAECRRWVSLTPKAIGKSKLYCSNKCKQAARYKRVKPKQRRSS